MSDKPGESGSFGRPAKALLVIAITIALASAALPAGAAAGPRARIEPRVLEQMANRGEATFWVLLRDRARLAPARLIQDWDARGRMVYERLRATADQSQAGIRALLTKRGVPYSSYWIVNALRVTADQRVLNELAAQPEVKEILADGKYRIPKPEPGVREPRILTVEWNIERVRAPEVWSGFGVRGEDIVVANIDTGVEFTHSALVRQYRGNEGGGVFDHNYDWFDPSQICGSPSLQPCDNVFHGTHTMGTMVGDDGDPGPNQIGVAPHARWIAAKGCEFSSCSFDALIRSGQWVLAPTDLNGQNPRPDLRPHVVNNSWGGGPGDPFYRDTVNAWVASGIFPAFASGNPGPFCGGTGSPGDYPESYGVGAHDINNNIADFSGRGPSAFGGIIKPNNAAPGVNVRSAVPGDSYDSFNGTSMATPHTAATVALMWSAAPSLVGDIAGTRTLLDQTAIDTSDLSCGGTPENNNVWGEGRLDAFAAVDASPVGPTGFIEGTVTDASTGNPIAGARVRAENPDFTRTTETDAAGFYSVRLPVGIYDVRASAFGYVPETATGVEVTQDAVTVRDFALQPAPSHPVSGHVRDSDGNPIEGATVTILSTPIPPATTDATGFYSFPSVPTGEYDVRAEAGRCNESQTQHLVVDGPETLDFALPQRSDAFGYFCQIVAIDYVEGTTPLPLFGDDASTEVELPFSFTFYGQSYGSAHVSTNGFLNFLAPDATFFNSAIPSPSTPNGAIYPYWDDLFVDGSATVFTDTLGEAPNRRYVIEWRNVAYFGDFSRRVDFEVILHENGRILTQYRNIADDGRERGNSATIGIENEDGSIALQYSFNEAVIDSPEFAVLYRIPPSGFVQGSVTDANDGLAVAGATIRALQDGAVVRQTTTDAGGFYRIQLPLGTYTVEAAASNYSTESAQVVLDVEDEVITQDFVLRTARAEVSPTSLEFLVPPDRTRTKVLTLSNTGSLDMTWEIQESGGGRTASSTAGSGEWLSRSEEGVKVRTNAGGEAVAHPSSFRWRPDQGTSQVSVLVYADDAYHTSPNTFIDQALQRLGLPYTAHYDADFGGFESDLSTGTWDFVLFGNDNFFPPDSTLTAMNNYVAGGGKLVVLSWTMGFNPGHPLWTTVGADWMGDDFDPPDPVHWWEPSHPVFTNPEQVPEFTDLEGFRYGIYGQRVEPLSGFQALAGFTSPGPDPNQAAMVLGNDGRTIFRGFMDGQNDADRDGDGLQDGVELWANLITGMQFGFFADVPWLSENPVSGTLAPGADQAIDVTVDTTGLEPGAYSANIFVLSNSGREPTLQVPVTLVVPAYLQGANAGGGAYTDSQGDDWAADQAYSAGSWGYTNPTAGRFATRRPIAGTDDDPLYQDQRVNPAEYRFDGLAPGVYQVELRFAELQFRRVGARLFDVTIEGDVVLFAHDIFAEVGANAADDQTFFVPVTDGRLNVRFITRRGFGQPVVNAVRVIHRPDRAA